MLKYFTVLTKSTRNVEPSKRVAFTNAKPPPGAGYTNTSIRQGKKVTRTYTPKAAHQQHNWILIDAKNVVLGRLASHAATLLRGKHKTTYAPHLDMGDNVIIINADKVVLTNGKAAKKLAWRHSGYPGGIRSTTYTELLEKNPERAVEKAIRGMLPKTSLGRQQIKKLKVYAGENHPHAAQKPTNYTFTQVAQ